MKPSPTSRIVAIALTVVALAGGNLNVARAQSTNKSTWEGSAALGLTLTRGNSKTLLANATVQGSDKWDKNELLLSASVTYGENDNQKTTEAADGNAQYNRLFSERLYGGLKLDLFHDGIADIRYRVTVAPLAGYYFIKSTNVTLSGEVGPGFIYANQGGKTKSYLTARAAERFEYKLSATARVWQTAEFLPQVDNVNNYLLNLEVGAEAGLTKKLSLRAVLQDYYNNRPASGRLKNDLRLITGVAYKF